MTDHSHHFSAWPFSCPVSSAAFCTARVAREHFPVLQISHDVDGDWQFLDATEDDPGECVMLCLGCVLERDATLAEIADLPLGWGAMRDEIGAPWKRWQLEADDGDDEDGADHDHAACNSQAADARALADIAQYGLHIIQVREAPGSPPFAYSIGIERSLGMPELIVIGLKGTLAPSMINECYRQMKEGIQIRPGMYVEGLLGGGFKCLVAPVSTAQYEAYMGWALWLYQGAGFRALQLIYPTTTAVFPWEPASSESFKAAQPILAADFTPPPA